MPIRIDGTPYLNPDFTDPLDYFALISLFTHFLLCSGITIFTFIKPHKLAVVNYYLRLVNTIAFITVTLNIIDFFTPGNVIDAYIWALLMYFNAMAIAEGQLEILKKFVILAPDWITVTRIKMVQIFFAVFYFFCNILLYIKVGSVGKQTFLDDIMFFPLTIMLVVVILYEEVHNIFLTTLILKQLSKLMELRMQVAAAAVSNISTGMTSTNVPSGANTGGLFPGGGREGHDFVVIGYRRVLLLLTCSLLWDTTAAIMIVITSISSATRYSFNVLSCDLALYHIVFVSLIFYRTQNLKVEAVEIGGKGGKNKK